MSTTLRHWRNTAVLLTLLTALAPGLRAQVNHAQDFNGCNAANCNNWTISGGFSPNITSVSGTGYSPCANSSAKSNIYGSDVDTYLTSNTSLGTSNGSLVTVTFSYKCLNYSSGTATPAGYCTFTVQWSTNGSTWTNVGSTFNNISSGSCTTSPARTFTPASGSPVYIRIWAHRNNGDFWAVMDNISVTQSGGPAYCTTGLYSGGAGENCTDGDDIDDISFANVNQTNTGCTGGTGIADYTGTTANVSQGATVPFTITTNYSGLHGVAWYLDGNNDGDFDDANEYIGSASVTGLTITGSFTVPGSVPVGNHRLRVRLQYGSTPTSTQSCTQFTYGETHDYTANVSAGALPGENCGNAQNLALLTSPYSATTVGYANDISVCRTGYPDRIFYIDVPNGSQLTIGESTNIYDEWEYIGYGPTCPGATQIQCWDNDALAQTTWVNNTGSTQTVWYVQDAYTGSGTFTLQWSVTTPGCTNTTSYPSAFNAPAPFTSAYTISTCQYQSEYNTMNNVVAGHSFLSTASIAGTFITVRSGTYNGPVVAYGTTPLAWTAASAGTYYIHYNTNSSCGTANTCMTTTVQNTTTNDLCANAMPIASLPFTGAPVSNAAGTDDVPVSGCSGPYKNMWWTVTGVCGTMTASSCGSSFDTEIAVFTGSCGSFTEVGCNDDNGPACGGLQGSVSWTGTAGTTYYISVGSYGPTSGTGNINLTVTGGDITPPSITCPGTQTACNTMPDLTGLATVSDNCTAPGSITVTQSPAPGSALALGITSVTLTATDQASNSAQCSFNVEQLDSDGDLTADCNDGCPADPNKIAPGQCGCGVADTDGDADGTADCNDLCPTDPNKIAPGQCGCGVADTDGDADGTADCNDGCPSDPNKIAPGICGCGVADTDTDADGTADCNDGCPSDPNKIAPGICGCGVADTDTDADGTADCNDGCPSDPNKIDPGICGCGVADTDTDADGTADCNDGCPTDPNKIAPGQCGCGVPDDDYDMDGTADCNDACPDDPDKVVPGICGCSTPDDDTDSDGLADCIDPCPESPTNDDTDGDGTADCYDGCPNDPLKITPGACGCGVSEVDSDGDSYYDCVDGCPSDPLKIGPGACGCGVPENDSDADGTPDCLDSCPMLAGQVGDPCDDGNPMTTGDEITSGCECAGTDPNLCLENGVSLELTTDAQASQTTWEIVDNGNLAVVCNGGGYADNTLITATCCLPDGCYKLTVYDSAGDGISPGGFTLRDADGHRIIDNAGNGALFAYESSAPFGFCVPIGPNALMAESCDVLDATPNTVLRAVIDPAVTAQYGLNNSNSGYQFWFFNPNGGYNRRILLTHTSPGNGYLGGSPVAERCSYLRLSQMESFPIPLDIPLNVRVRTQVAGVFNEFGPACRLLLPTPACPTVQLTTIASPIISCGATGLNSSSTIWANLVVSATNYQFEFSRPGYTRRIVSSSRSQRLDFQTYPLLNNTCYNVRVRVSFDNGSTYCPFGPYCTITMGNAVCDFGGGMAQEDDEVTNDVLTTGTRMQLWPNPTDGSQVNIALSGFATSDDGLVGVDLLDGTGRQVHQATMVLESGRGTASLQLPDALAPGTYLVRIQVGSDRIIERLVVQR